MRIGSGRRYGVIVPVESKDICDICCKGNKAIFEDVFLAIQLEYIISNIDN